MAESRRRGATHPTPFGAFGKEDAAAVQLGGEGARGGFVTHKFVGPPDQELLDDVWIANIKYIA